MSPRRLLRLPLRPALPLAACLIAAGATGAAQANRYTLVDLGPAKYPSQINDRDQIAGSGRNDHAIVWRAGRWHKLDAQVSHAEAINGAGDVAGDNGDGPVLWQRHEPARALPLPDSATFGLAFGINDALTVVGLFFQNADNTIRCFEWTEGGGSVDLGFMGAGDHCEASAINRRGQVTGEASTTPLGPPHAFVFQDGAFADLGTLPQGDGSQGLAINSHGDVAGRATVPPLDDMHWHAAVWRDGQLVDLDPDSTINQSVAADINDRGDIVGTVTIDDQFTQRAVRFTSRGIVKLDGEVRNLAGWHVIQAQGVNLQGDIVGVGLGPGGHPHGVLLMLESAD
jgi:probable HAF family extracellular repeat protein